MTSAAPYPAGCLTLSRAAKKFEYRRATCATETPGARVCRQIERFSSSDQNRFLCPFLPVIKCLKMSIIDHGHCRPLAPTRGRGALPAPAAF